MTYRVDYVPPNKSQGKPLARAAAASFNVLDELSAALAPRWNVEQETDYLGAVSFVALPADDDPAMPAFILYEKGGRAGIATIQGDDWEVGQTFTSQRQAVAKIIAGAATLLTRHAYR
jgi:hypothetical protein